MQSDAPASRHELSRGPDKQIAGIIRDLAIETVIAKLLSQLLDPAANERGGIGRAWNVNRLAVATEHPLY